MSRPPVHTSIRCRHPRWSSRAARAALLGVLLPSLSACRNPAMTGDPVRVDPSDVSRDSGGTDEILEVSQRTVEALLACRGLDADQRYRIMLGRIVNATGLRAYDENVFYNQLLSTLIGVAGDRFVFLDRESVLEERANQAEGLVESRGAGELAGADLVLVLELRNQRGADTRAIQYTAKVVSLEGDIRCAPSFIIKKRT